MTTEKTRIIKKYPNRRLYDTAISSYITLDDVKQLVLDCIAFQVIDTRTKDDLTHSTLLQIITEQEDSGKHIFTNEVLQNLIRYYGNSMQSMVSSYLDQSLRLFLSQQTNQLEQLMQQNPFTLIQKIAEQNFSLWREVHSSIQADPTPANDKQEDTSNAQEKLCDVSS